ncbi:MAG: twin-arginine translocase TatA/TatE family subunit [Chloroflexota bacterium]|nr:twin-arginine translocase TatA/TatE family subunit [Chloroflexota bacterium]
MGAFAFDKPFTWVIILVIVLLIFGAGKLPEIGKSVGKSIKEFKSETQAGMKDAPLQAESKSPSGDFLSTTEPEVTVRRTIRKLEDGTEEIVEERVLRKKA